MFFKVLFITILVFYLLSKIGGYLLRTFAGKIFSQVNRANQNNYHNTSKRYQQPVDGNVNIDHIPNKDNTQSDDLGGDYVDYEEVK